MKVLVAGATGDVGRPTVRRLLQAGHEVVTFSRGRHPGFMGDGDEPLTRVSQISGNALDGEGTRRAIARASPDAVVDLLTALPRNGPTRPSHLEPTNELRRRGTTNLFRAAVEAGVHRYVAESIVFVYGYGAGDRVRTEDDPAGAEAGVSGKYAGALQAAVGKEQLVTSGPIEGVALRFGVFYGPKAGSTRYMARMLRRRLLGLPGGGRGIAPWIRVDDAADAVVAALERDVAGEVFNVVDDEPASFRDFAEELARRIGAPRPYGVPVWLARPFVPYATTFMSGSRLLASNDKAKSRLGWTPAHPSTREGLADFRVG